MRNQNLAMSWATLAGIVLVLVGLLGFLNTSIVGDSASALVPTGAVHNIVHLATGLLALFIAFGLRGEQQVNGVIGFGILYVIILVVVIASPTLFGLFSVQANTNVHLIHGLLAVVSLAVGLMARGSSTATAR